MRLIDADAIMSEFAEFVRASNNSDLANVPTWNDAVSLVGSAPTIEAEPKGSFYDGYAYCLLDFGKDKVLCKNCKYCITHEEILFCGYKGNIGDWRFRTETDFCSRGERREE